MNNNNMNVFDVWVFIDRLADFLDDKSLLNLSECNKTLYDFIHNSSGIWKRRLSSVCNNSNNDKKDSDWKTKYINNAPIYVSLRTRRHIKKYHIEYKNHPCGCFMRELSSKNYSLYRGNIFEIGDLDIMYYVISISKIADNTVAQLAILHNTNDNMIKYYKRCEINSFKIIKRANDRFTFHIYIKGHGVIYLPWKDFIYDNQFEERKEEK
jgi:hypothetical protein